MFNFEGIEIDLSKVLAVSDLKTFSVGNMSCDWEYGFDIYMQGNTVSFHEALENYGYVGDPSREDYKKFIMDKRAKLLEALNP